MARANITMTLTPQSKRELEKLGKARLAPELRRALYTSTSGAVPAVRAAARNLPSKQKTRTKKSLRSQLAMACQRRIKATSRGVYVAIVSAPRGGLSNLARAVEGEIPWHHPTFGGPPEVDQPHMPYFYETLDKILPGVEASVGEALIKFQSKL